MRVLEGNVVGTGMKIGIVAARFNEFIVSKLVGGAEDALRRHEVDTENNVDLAWVPGAFEIPMTAQKMAESGKYDAIICLGAVIKGSTSHYDYVCAEVSKGIATVGLNTGVPTIFGVLTTDNIEQAVERAGTKAGNKGYDAATTAIEMVNLMKSMVKTNTDLALGSAKELLEIVCKSILSEKKISYTDDMTLSKLFKETINSVGILESSSASNKEQADRSIRQILSGLNSVIQGVSELRNGYGSGHGKEASFKRLEPQYVEFVVSIVSNIVVFILQINGETTPLQN